MKIDSKGPTFIFFLQGGLLKLVRRYKQGLGAGGIKFKSTILLFLHALLTYFKTVFPLLLNPFDFAKCCFAKIVNVHMRSQRTILQVPLQQMTVLFSVFSVLQCNNNLIILI